MSITKKVMIFGTRILGESGVNPWKDENIELDLLRYPSTDFLGARRLADYRLVILNYAPFYVDGGIRTDHQDRFLKEMTEALKLGTHFCFLHYQEDVPREDEYSSKTGFMKEEDVQSFQRMQLGFRFLWLKNIRPYKVGYPLVHAENKRGEFVPYLKSYGATRNLFEPFSDGSFKGKFESVIQGLEGEVATGFVLKESNGLLLYLPYQYPIDAAKRREALSLLVDNTLTYLAKNEIFLPPWAGEPFFDEEARLQKELNSLKTAQQRLDDQLQVFSRFKANLFLSEGPLENGVRRLFNEGLGVKCDNTERYNEDFLLKGDKGAVIAIGEVKSTTKGFKKSFIFDAYNHRETNGYDESMAAVLVVNCHLQAQNIKEKIKPIPDAECAIAVQYNVLVVRVEDLLRLWEGLRTNVWTSDEIREKLCKSSGWLEVTDKFKSILHQG